MRNSKVTEEWPAKLPVSHRSLFTTAKVHLSSKVYLTSECIWPMEFRFYEVPSFLEKSVFDLRVYLSSDCETSLSNQLHHIVETASNRILISILFTKVTALKADVLLTDQSLLLRGKCTIPQPISKSRCTWQRYGRESALRHDEPVTKINRTSQFFFEPLMSRTWLRVIRPCIFCVVIK